MSNINIGIIGVGTVADRHINSLKEDGRVEVTWLCDLNEETLEAKMKEHNIEQGTIDYFDLLKDDKLDAVIISTPPNTHAKIFLDCINAEKHILLEKPMCTSKEEIDLIMEAAEEHKNLVLLDPSCRHARLQPKYRHIKKMINDGKLGDVYYIHHNHVMRQSRNGIEHNPGAKWFLDKKYAVAGPLIDWGVYDLSFHLGILNDVPQLEDVQSFTINGLDQVEHGAPVFDVEEHGVAYMKFDTGLRYYYERSSNAHNETSHETRIYGTKGGLKLAYTSWDSNEIEFFYVDEDGKGEAKSEIIKVDMDEHTGDEQELACHFVDCLLGEAEPMMPIPLAAKHISIILEILESAESLEKRFTL